MRYLEPDLVVYKDDCQYIIDAKYKSHMFNREKISGDLKESFRSDLHQVLAYSSFGITPNKRAILVYPATDFISQKLQISNPLTRAFTDVHLVGISLNIASIEDTKLELGKLID